MLSKATNLQTFALLKLYEAGDDVMYFEDRWDACMEESPDSWASNSDVRFLMSGEELAKFIWPTTRVWFDAMNSKGRD